LTGDTAAIQMGDLSTDVCDLPFSGAKESPFIDLQSPYIVERIAH